MARLRREHHRLLGNGYCTRPPELDCAFENIYETCTVFQTSIEFRSTLQRQRDHAAQLVDPDAVAARIVADADTGGTTQSPTPWWPGSGYVDMVGVDGYPDTEWGSQFGTFSGEFGPAFRDIRGVGWSGPIFVSEINLARLDSSGYESMIGFTNDVFNVGGSGYWNSRTRAGTRRR